MVVGEGEANNYEHYKHVFDDESEVIVQGADPEGDGAGLRGFSADLVVLLVDLSESVRTRVLQPMITVTGGKIINAY